MAAFLGKHSSDFHSKVFYGFTKPTRSQGRTLNHCLCKLLFFASTKSLSQHKINEGRGSLGVKIKHFYSLEVHRITPAGWGSAGARGISRLPAYLRKHTQAKVSHLQLLSQEGEKQQLWAEAPRAEWWKDGSRGYPQHSLGQQFSTAMMGEQWRMGEGNVGYSRLNPKILMQLVWSRLPVSFTSTPGNSHSQFLHKGPREVTWKDY